jgi:hypothetical protein
VCDRWAAPGEQPAARAVIEDQTPSGPAELRRAWSCCRLTSQSLAAAGRLDCAGRGFKFTEKLDQMFDNGRHHQRRNLQPLATKHSV